MSRNLKDMDRREFDDEKAAVEPFKYGHTQPLFSHKDMMKANLAQKDQPVTPEWHKLYELKEDIANRINEAVEDDCSNATLLQNRKQLETNIGLSNADPQIFRCSLAACCNIETLPNGTEGNETDDVEDPFPYVDYAVFFSSLLNAPSSHGNTKPHPSSRTGVNKPHTAVQNGPAKLRGNVCQLQRKKGGTDKVSRLKMSTDEGQRHKKYPNSSKMQFNRIFIMVFVLFQISLTFRTVECFPDSHVSSNTSRQVLINHLYDNTITNCSVCVLKCPSIEKAKKYRELCLSDFANTTCPRGQHYYCGRDNESGVLVEGCFQRKTCPKDGTCDNICIGKRDPFNNYKRDRPIKTEGDSSSWIICFAILHSITVAALSVYSFLYHKILRSISTEGRHWIVSSDIGKDTPELFYNKTTTKRNTMGKKKIKHKAKRDIKQMTQQILKYLDDTLRRTRNYQATGNTGKTVAIIESSRHSLNADQLNRDPLSDNQAFSNIEATEGNLNSLEMDCNTTEKDYGTDNEHSSRGKEYNSSDIVLNFQLLDTDNSKLKYVQEEAGVVKTGMSDCPSTQGSEGNTSNHSHLLTINEMGNISLSSQRDYMKVLSPRSSLKLDWSDTLPGSNLDNCLDFSVQPLIFLTETSYDWPTTLYDLKVHTETSDDCPSTLHDLKVQTMPKASELDENSIEKDDTSLISSGYPEYNVSSEGSSSQDLTSAISEENFTNDHRIIDTDFSQLQCFEERNSRVDDVPQLNDLSDREEETFVKKTINEIKPQQPRDDEVKPTGQTHINQTTILNIEVPISAPTEQEECITSARLSSFNRNSSTTANASMILYGNDEYLTESDEETVSNHQEDQMICGKQDDTISNKQEVLVIKIDEVPLDRNIIHTDKCQNGNSSEEINSKGSKGCTIVETFANKRLFTDSHLNREGYSPRVLRSLVKKFNIKLSNQRKTKVVKREGAAMFGKSRIYRKKMSYKSCHRKFHHTTLVCSRCIPRSPAPERDDSVLSQQNDKYEIAITLISSLSSICTSMDSVISIDNELTYLTHESEENEFKHRISSRRVIPIGSTKVTHFNESFDNNNKNSCEFLYVNNDITNCKDGIDHSMEQIEHEIDHSHGIPEKEYAAIEPNEVEDKICHHASLNEQSRNVENVEMTIQIEDNREEEEIENKDDQQKFFLKKHSSSLLNTATENCKIVKINPDVNREGYMPRVVRSLVKKFNRKLSNQRKTFVLKREGPAMYGKSRSRRKRMSCKSCNRKLLHTNPVCSVCIPRSSAPERDDSVLFQQNDRYEIAITLISSLSNICTSMETVISLTSNLKDLRNNLKEAMMLNKLNRKQLEKKVLNKENQLLKSLDALNSELRSDKFMQNLRSWSYFRPDPLQLELGVLPGLHDYFQRVEQGPISREESMNYEWIRLSSLRSYTGAGSAIQLAKHGFYHDPEHGPLATRCYACDLLYTNWEYFDSIEDKHRRLSPNCPLVRNDEPTSQSVSIASGSDRARPQATVEVPQVKETQQTTASVTNVTSTLERINIRDMVPEGFPTQPTEDRFNSEYNRSSPSTSVQGAVFGQSSTGSPGRSDLGPDTNNTATGASTNENVSRSQSSAISRQDPSGADKVRERTQAGTSATSSISGLTGEQSDSTVSGLNDPQQVVVMTPKHSEYTSIDSRSASFTAMWPSYLDQTPRKMAEAGFFYAGVADFTRCFACGGGLRNWESGDDPCLEHTRWYPRCEYMNKLKGTRYIQAVMRRQEQHVTEQRRRQQQQQQQQRRQAATSNTPQDPLTTPAALVLLEMGYSRERVEEAILAVRRNTGNNSVNAEQAMVWILDQEERAESTAPASTQQTNVVQTATTSASAQGSTRTLTTASNSTTVHSSVSTSVTSAASSTSLSTTSSQSSTASGESTTSSTPPSASVTSSQVPSTKGQCQGSSQDATGGSRSGSPKAKSGATTLRSGTPTGNIGGKGKSANKSGGKDFEKKEGGGAEGEQPLGKPKKRNGKKKGKGVNEVAGGSSLRVEGEGSSEPSEIDTQSLKEENKKLREMQTCKICMDKPVNMTLLPCGHLVCCEACAPHLRKCPICRKRIEGSVKTFMS